MTTAEYLGTQHDWDARTVTVTYRPLGGPNVLTAKQRILLAVPAPGEMPVQPRPRETGTDPGMARASPRTVTKRA
jgi:hypothetical protein